MEFFYKILAFHKEFLDILVASNRTVDGWLGYVEVNVKEMTNGRISKLRRKGLRAAAVDHYEQLGSNITQCC